MTQTTATTGTAPAIDLSAEGGASGWEWVALGVTVLVAVIYLARKLGGRKGSCGSCGKGGACVTGCQPRDPANK